MARIVKQKRRQFSKSERLFIYEKYDYTCQICNLDLHELPNERILDHKIPLSKGGSNKISNIWLLCNSCDKSKKSDILSNVIKDRLTYLKNKNVCTNLSF